MTETRTIAINEDPVCGMQVDVDHARANGLHRTRQGRDVGCCGKGCLLEFGEGPETYLDAGYQPEM